MALSVPGMSKIEEILKKVSAKIESSVTNDVEPTSQPLDWMSRLKTSISFKLMLLAGFFLMIALLFLLSSSFRLVNAVAEYNKVELIAPKLEDYLPSVNLDEKGTNLASNEQVLSDKEEAANADSKKTFEVEKDMAIDKAFEFLAKFENRKSQKTLMSIRPVISNIQRSSAAEDAGVQIGDMILKINGAPIESVYGYYLATTDKPSMELSLDIDRKGKVSSIKLISNTNLPLSSNNVGISFVLPNGIGYVTQEDVKKLSTEYKESFLSTIPLDRQKLFANNLMRMTQKISNESQILTTTSTPSNYPIAKLKTPAFLDWQHQKFMEIIDRFYNQRREKESHIMATLSSLGDALTALAAAAIVSICAVMYFVFFSKK